MREENKRAYEITWREMYWQILIPSQTLSKIIRIFLLNWSVSKQIFSSTIIHRHISAHNSYLRVIRSFIANNKKRTLTQIGSISLSQFSCHMIVRQPKIPNCVDSEIACSTTNKTKQSTITTTTTNIIYKSGEGLFLKHSDIFKTEIAIDMYVWVSECLYVETNPAAAAAATTASNQQQKPKK